ncbi:MAG: pantoate--beta-alanine ligase [Candidatus Fermentibacteraceae bacterium]
MRIVNLECEAAAITHEWSAGGSTIGFVPTMGALHEGHVSLVREARARCGKVVVSIFVNPIQFGPGEDLGRYPRMPDADYGLLAGEGADLVFAPTPETVYPPGFSTLVEVTGLTSGLCGASRPGHFRGVTTVCCALFNIIGPDVAVFGEKDFQQLAVIRRMVSDLRLKPEIVQCPIVREPDGLAMSSRNAYLSPDERAQAALIYRGLTAVSDAAGEGETDLEALKAVFRNVLSRASLLSLSYLEAVDPDSLEPAENLDRTVRLLAAVYAGSTRLIDNISLEPPHPSRRTGC